MRQPSVRSNPYGVHVSIRTCTCHVFGRAQKRLGCLFRRCEEANPDDRRQPWLAKAAAIAAVSWQDLRGGQWAAILPSHCASSLTGWVELSPTQLLVADELSTTHRQGDTPFSVQHEI